MRSTECSYIPPKVAKATFKFCQTNRWKYLKATYMHFGKLLIQFEAKKYVVFFKRTNTKKIRVVQAQRQRKTIQAHTHNRHYTNKHQHTNTKASTNFFKLSRRCQLKQNQQDLKTEFWYWTHLNLRFVENV